MNALPIPPITELHTGLDYLARLPLANPAQAIPALRQFYENLIHGHLPAKIFLQLLEQARLPLATVVEAHRRRFWNKALPLNEAEDMAFHDAFESWQLAAEAYARCAQLDSGNDAEHGDRIALVLHRCIQYVGLAIHEHRLARRELPAGMWLDLFGYYASAEEWNIAKRPLSDPLEPDQTGTDCTAALVTEVLIDLAGPYSFGVREINLIRRWAVLWSPLVAVEPVGASGQKPTYVVDLMQDTGPKYSPDVPANADQRRLDTSRLATKITEIVAQLRQGAVPAQLELGDDVIGSHCLKILDKLSRPWTQASSPFRYERRPTTGVAQMAIGFASIHLCVAGHEFVQPEKVLRYTREGEFESMFAIRQVLDPKQRLDLKRDLPTYAWQLLNQSLTGFRLERHVAGQNLAHGQLLGLKPPDAERMLLAQTRWLMQEQSGGVIAGVETMPGLPAAVAARSTGINVSAAEPYSPIFMLPEVAAMRAEASLVLPHGWFQAGRVLEILSEPACRAKLTELIERGADFDHVGYVLVR